MERKTYYRGRLLKIELLAQRLSAINLWLKVVLGWASTVGVTRSVRCLWGARHLLLLPLNSC